MKRRNRWISLALVVSMLVLVALTGCSGSSDSGSSSSSSGSAASGDSGSASTGEAQYQMRIAYSYADNTQHGKNAIFFEETVEELTEGRVDVVLYPNSQIAPLNEELNMVKAGAVEAAYTINGIAETVNPLEGMLTTPFAAFAGPGDPGILRQMVEDEQVGGIIAKWAEEAGFKSFGTVQTNFGTVICANNVRPVETPADAAGLKLRHYGGDMMTIYYDALGANGVTIAGAEAPVALSQGVVDGTPSGMLHIHDAQWFNKYITYPYSLCGTMPFYCNLEWWNSLPADIQDIIENQAIPKLNDYAYEAVAEAEEVAYANMLEEPFNCEYVTWDLTDPEIAAFTEQVMMDGLNHFIEKYGEDAQTIANRIIELREEYMAAQ